MILILLPIFLILAFFLLNSKSPKDKELSIRAKRLREINQKGVQSMEEENERRVLIGYPYLLEVVKERCPKCGGKMWHDNFEKCWNYSGEIPHMEACYNCIDCKYSFLFDLITNKFDKKPFGQKNKV